MKRNLDLFLLFACGLLTCLVAAVFQTTPGYMDASYSYAGGLQLVNGNGFVEPFLWNYLDNPADVIHPSHTYWMPLPSLVAALGMFLSGSHTYLAARSIFILMAACIPVLTALLAYSMTRSRQQRIVAGLLAIFPGFYLIFSTGTETFTLYMFFGSLFFLFVFPKQDDSPVPGDKQIFIRYFLLGVLAGAMHLTRADGILWLIGAMCAGIWSAFRIAKTGEGRRWLFIAGVPLVVLFGYLLFMFPWYARNLALYSRLFSPGGSRTLWLTEYDQTYIFPPDLLNYQAWLAAGFPAHLNAWGSALLQNLGTFIGVQGCVIYFPLIIIGMINLRKKNRIILGLGMWLMIFGAMSVIFPFAGPRGGFFHSGAGVQPLFWSVVPVGLESILNLGVRWRGWKLQRAFPLFSAGLVVICAIVTAFLYYQRVIGTDFLNPRWQAQERHYQLLEESLQQHRVPSGARVMVNDPPGYYVAAKRQAVAVPYGNLTTVLDVADKFNIAYLLLEPNHPDGLQDIYLEPADRAGLDYLGTIEDTRIYRLCPLLDCPAAEDW